MLTTIEQKHSAIKAINEEKDKVDAYIQRITGWHTDISTIILSNWGDEAHPFRVPNHVGVEVMKVLLQHYSDYKAELISKAQELMK